MLQVHYAFGVHLNPSYPASIPRAPPPAPPGIRVVLVARVFAHCWLLLGRALEADVLNGAAQSGVVNWTEDSFS